MKQTYGYRAGQAIFNKTASVHILKRAQVQESLTLLLLSIPATKAGQQGKYGISPLVCTPSNQAESFKATHLLDKVSD